MRFIARAAVVAALFACLLFRPDAGMAQGEVPGPSCGPFKAIEAQLTGGKWGEELVAVGIAAGMPSRLYVSQAGTWTLLLLPKPDVACIHAAGTDFGFAKPGKPKGDEL